MSFDVAEGAELVVAVAPVFLDLYKQFEVDMLVEEFLDIFSGLGADLLEHRAPFSYDDTFLRVAFNIDNCHDVYAIFFLVKLLYHNLHRVGHLLVEVEQHLLTDDLGDEESGRFVGKRILPM